MIAGPARRQLLAALASRCGAAVSAATLIEDLWGEAPPRSALTSLRSHAMRLRADLARGGSTSMLATAGDGYRLCIGSGDVDAGRFAELVANADEGGDPKWSIAQYDEALGLWQTRDRRLSRVWYRRVCGDRTGKAYRATRGGVGAANRPRPEGRDVRRAGAGIGAAGARCSLSRARLDAVGPCALPGWTAGGCAGGLSTGPHGSG